MKWLDGYKAVRVRRSGKYASYIESVGGENFSGIHYSVGLISKPKKSCGPLCVFTSYDAAKCFIGNDLTIYSNKTRLFGMKIFKCKYKPSRRESVWKGYQGKSGGRNLQTLPQGTALATQVKLVEEVC